jgi:hypothetical protein
VTAWYDAAPSSEGSDAVDWLGEPVAAPKPAVGSTFRNWLAEEGIEAEVTAKAEARVARFKAKAPKRDLIPPADAWLIFRAVTAPDDPDGPVDHVEGLRVVRGRDLSERMRRGLRGEPKDWDWDIPLLRERPDERPVILGEDPAKDPAAAWRRFCREWRFAPAEFEAAAEAISHVAGLEWVHEQWQRGKR